MTARKDPADESIRLELQEALITFRHWTAQANQAGGVAATVDALLIAYGFSQRLAGILFLASLMPIVVLLIYLQIMSAAAPIITLAMRLERKLSFRADSLAITYAKLHMRPLISKVPSLSSLDDNELLDLDHYLLQKYWLRKQIPVILYSATIIQAGLAAISLTVYNYRFM